MPEKNEQLKNHPFNPQDILNHGTEAVIPLGKDVLNLNIKGYTMASLLAETKALKLEFLGCRDSLQNLSPT